MSKNIQTLVPREVHKELVDEAYQKDLPLWKLLQNIIQDYLEKKKGKKE